MNYTKVFGDFSNHRITVYSLSTCPHCTSVKNYLTEKKFSFKYINVDQATRDEKREITLFLKDHNLAIAFPVIVIDDRVFQGFDQKDIETQLSPET